MAITYPLNTPTTGICIENINLRAVNVVGVSKSPFTGQEQIIQHQGQWWEADISLPNVHRDKAAPWKAFLISLKGQVGTFLLGDPDYKTPQGDVSSCVLTGSLGAETASVVMTGTFKAGDYIQLGTGLNTKLHTVLVDQTGDGDLEVWPALRSDYTSEAVIFNEPKGLFRLNTPITQININAIDKYGISFTAAESI